VAPLTLAFLEQPAPEEAVPIFKIEAAYMAHKARISSIAFLFDMLEAIKSPKVEELISNGSLLAPVLEELAKVSQNYQRMIQATVDRQFRMRRRYEHFRLLAKEVEQAERVPGKGWASAS
jgi:hypothetical protein